jgi:hypothetical protein
MARMMPAFCPQAAPPGEKALYAALAESVDSREWIVLHSMGIADHVRQVEGEADFVVIVPESGILVIEVKSHLSVSRLDDGSWQLGSQRPTGRSPFQQAGENMHSVRQYLMSRNVDLRSIPVCSAVWFTSVRARTTLPASPEWHHWQVLDSTDLQSGVSAAIMRTLRAGTDHLTGKITGFLPGEPVLSRTAADRIAAVLRPRFEVATALGDRRRDRDAQLFAFLDEQYTALDAMQDNQSVLFTGPAGSGKTLLAMEAARREVAQGRRGRLLCFNRLLGHRITADMCDLPGLKVGTLHQELLRLAGVGAPQPARETYWAETLPALAIEALLDGGEDPAEDFLIIDEVQDIARESFIDVLDLLVTGGLRNGRVLLFGDFERQAIFDGADGRELLKSSVANLSTHRLTANCRNLPRIGYLVNAFSKLQPGYRRFRRQDDGVDPTFLPYGAGDEQAPELVEAIRVLRADGYDLNEIAVLSPLASGSTAQATTDRWLRQVLRHATGDAPRPGCVQHCTIHAFKGLEAPAVIVTDLDHRQVPNFESLLYVGLTRARDRLVALIEAGTLQMALGGSR